MCTRDDHRYCQELRPILEITENAKSSTAIVHIERDLKYIDAANWEISGNFPWKLQCVVWLLKI
jgi:hypothetical protein